MGFLTFTESWSGRRVQHRNHLLEAVIEGKDSPPAVGAWMETERASWGGWGGQVGLWEGG